MSNIYRRGESVFLYVHFKDEEGNSINIESPKVRVISEKDLLSVIDDENLQKLYPSDTTNSEYYLNYIIPNTWSYGTYEIAYMGDYGTKKALVVESFKLIPTSNVYENTVKLYGYVHQENNSLPIVDVFVEFYSENEKDVVFESRTNSIGKWEAQIYPGKYIITFNKYGYNDVVYDVQIGYEHTEMQFDNVVMDLSIAKTSGEGIYRVHEKYVTKEGMEIFGIEVKAYNVADIDRLVAENTTNKDGEWELFLDPGMYLLTISGVFYGTNYSEKFRLKVLNDGKFSFENLSKNVAIPVVDNEIGNGDATNISNIRVTDVVIDKEGYPIVDVQVNVFRKGDMNNIIAQDYTNPAGEWSIYIPAGTYIFEFYHPNFDVITKEEKIS